MITLKQERSTWDRQRGIALLMALVALLLISAITAGMIVLTNTETNVSSNFRDEQLAFFSAKAGIEEARDRMQLGVTNTLRPVSGSVLPTTLPATLNTDSVLYILNPANGETVAPWKEHQHFLSRRRNLLGTLHDLQQWLAKPVHLHRLVRFDYGKQRIRGFAGLPLEVGAGHAEAEQCPHNVIPPMAAALPLCKLAGTGPMKKPPAVRHPIFCPSMF